MLLARKAGLPCWPLSRVICPICRTPFWIRPTKVWKRFYRAGQPVCHRGIFMPIYFPIMCYLCDRLTGIIDFYFACQDIYAYDIAVCLNSWCFDADGSFNVTKSGAILQGYESQRPLLDAGKQALPILNQGAAMRFFLTRLYDWINTPKDALVKPLNPLEFWSRLRFHQRAKGLNPMACGIRGKDERPGCRCFPLYRRGLSWQSGTWRMGSYPEMARTDKRAVRWPDRYHQQIDQMELTVVIRGLAALKRPVRVHIITDSKYVMDGVQDWATDP